MKIANNFELKEFTKSQTAARKGIDNNPSNEIIKNLQTVARKICQPIRNHFDRPVYITSGYRSETLNKSIGGSSTSQHVFGQAADMEIPGISNYDMAIWIRDNLDFDQLILENYTEGVPNSGWVHCSYVNSNKNRKEIMTALFDEYGNVNYVWGLKR